MIPRLLVAAASVVVVAAGATAGLLHQRSTTDGVTTQGRSSTPAPGSAVSRDAAEAREAAAAVRALTTDPSSLVATGAEREVAGRATQGVPPGSEVAAEESSWAPDGVGGGTLTVTITAPGQPPTRYAAVMVHETSGWKVLATVPLGS